MKRISYALVIGICVAIIGIAVLLVGKPYVGGTTASDEIAYAFDCAGRYLRIDLTTAKSSSPRALNGVPSAGAYDGCLVSGIQADSQNRMLYAVLPNEATVDSAGQRTYKVVGLTLPSLNLANSLTISPSLDQPPRIVLNRHDDELLVNYGVPQAGAPNGIKNVVQYLSTKTQAQPASRNSNAISARPSPFVSASTKGPVSPFALISHNPHFDAAGRLIDGYRIIDPSGTIDVVSGYSLVTNSLRQLFAPLQRTGASGKKYLDIVFDAAAADRMLFVVGWDTYSNQSPAGGGVVVYDSVTNKVVSSFLTPYREAPYDGTYGTPTVHLTPDGKTVVIEQYGWREEGSGSSTLRGRVKTGTLALYSADTGLFLNMVHVNLGSNDGGKVVGFSSDSSLMYYLAGSNLYVVNLSDGESQAIPLPGGFIPSAVVTTAG